MSRTGLHTVLIVAAERRWGHSIWLWRALAVSALASVALLLLSLTEDGRIFAVLLLIAEAFVAVTAYVRWARSERTRFEAELEGPGDSGF